MPHLKANHFLSVGAVILGAFYGYLVWVRFIAFPIEWLTPTLPFMKHAAARIHQDWNYEIVLVMLLFLASIPNTAIVSALTAYTIHRTKKMRSIIYGSLLFPLFLFVYHWLITEYRASIAESRGIDPSWVYRIETAEFLTISFLIFAIYSSYLLLVFFLARKITGGLQRKSEAVLQSVNNTP